MFNEILAQLGAFFTGILNLAQGGFQDVNQSVGLVIALIAAIFYMGSWRSLPGVAAGAALVHILIGVLRPLLDGGSIALPNILSVEFWTSALALFLGYAVVIAVFFLIKSLLSGGKRHAHAH